MTADSALDGTFAQICRELNIHTESVRDFQDASDRLNQGKYEAVILDADTVPAAIPVLSAVRSSCSNRSAVAFVVATETTDNEQALERRAHFLFHRPIHEAEIRRTLRSAYDLILGESRRYFRCSAEIPVTISRTGGMVQCTTVNVSGNGIAVRSPVLLSLAETLQIEFALPDGFVIHAGGLVVWHDGEGNTGFRFHCREPEMRQKLDAWLDSQYACSTSARA